MEVIISSLIPILIVFLIAVFFALFISVFGYFIYRINSTDYSDQTGWMNFAKPFLAIALIIILVQAIIAGIIIVYSYYSRS